MNNCINLKEDLKIKIGIDASNIRTGGGLVHLTEILNHLEETQYGIKEIVVWGNSYTLSKLKEAPFIKKQQQSLLEKSLLFRIFWRMFLLDYLLDREKCDVFFAPGGSYTGRFRPFVVMCQNILPFEWKEILRYKYSFFFIKSIILNLSLKYSFKKADGIIFLTEYSRKLVFSQINSLEFDSVIINHGVDLKFSNKPRIQKSLKFYNEINPFKILYVSFVGEYKHQWVVVEAISELKELGYPVELNLVGAPVEKRAYKKLKQAIEKYDKKGEIVKYYKLMPYEEIQKIYKNSDLFVFSSSCEAFGQILTEAMASGLPIACSNKSAMQEIVGDGAVYFNPESAQETKLAILKLLKSKSLRTQIVRKSYRKSLSFSWKKCSNLTFEYIRKIYIKKQDYDAEFSD